MSRRLASITAGATAALVAAVLAGGASAAGAQTGVAPTCAALQSFVDHGTIVDEDERLAAGRADLKQAIAAARASDDTKLLKMTVKFRVALEAAIDKPNKRSTNRALDQAGLKLWGYCRTEGSPITPASRTPSTTTPSTSVTPGP